MAKGSGKSLAAMEPILNTLHSKYGAHVCGEGGEYETYTLDCPLFYSRISLEKTLVKLHGESSHIAPVAYLRLLSAKLSPKANDSPNLDGVALPSLFDPESAETMHELGSHLVPSSPQPTRKSLAVANRLKSSVSRRTDWIVAASIFGITYGSIGQTLENEVEEAFKHLEDSLAESSLTFVDIAHINLTLSSMSFFSEVNRIYAMKFGTSPPTRACVASHLPGNARVMLDAIARRPASSRNSQDRVALHVQSRSYWAPANIGPYSQAVMVGSRIFVSGQIGLIPATMNLPSPSSFLEEAVLSLQHARRILATFQGPEWIESVVCYMIDMSHLEQARMVWQSTQSLYHKDIPVLFLEVLELPRGAQVEWQVLAGTCQPSTEQDDENEVAHGPEYVSGNRPAFYGCKSSSSRALTVIGTALPDPDMSLPLPRHHVSYIRGFYSTGISADEGMYHIFLIDQVTQGEC